MPATILKSAQATETAIAIGKVPLLNQYLRFAFFLTQNSSISEKIGNFEFVQFFK